MPPGQPTKLTPEVIEDVRRLLPTVLYMDTVGDYLGIARQTWAGWLRRGAVENRRLAKGGTPDPKEALYLEYFVAHKRALAEGVLYDAGIIKKAAATQWQAAAWRLERRQPAQWGRKDRVDVTTRPKGPPEVTEVVVATRAEAAALLALMGDGNGEAPPAAAAAPDRTAG